MILTVLSVRRKRVCEQAGVQRGKGKARRCTKRGTWSESIIFFHGLSFGAVFFPFLHYVETDTSHVDM